MFIAYLAQIHVYDCKKNVFPKIWYIIPDAALDNSCEEGTVGIQGEAWDELLYADTPDCARPKHS